jgi:hypothetical protein
MQHHRGFSKDLRNFVRASESHHSTKDKTKEKGPIKWVDKLSKLSKNDNISEDLTNCWQFSTYEPI